MQNIHHIFLHKRFALILLRCISFAMHQRRKFDIVRVILIISIMLDNELSS